MGAKFGFSSILCSVTLVLLPPPIPPALECICPGELPPHRVATLAQPQTPHSPAGPAIHPPGCFPTHNPITSTRGGLCASSAIAGGGVALCGGGAVSCPEDKSLADSQHHPHAAGTPGVTKGGGAETVEGSMTDESHGRRKEGSV